GTAGGRLFFDSHAAGKFVMNCVFNVLAKETRVAGLDTRDEDAIVMLQQTPGDLQNLLRGFASAENDLREAFPQSPMRIHLREPEVRHRCGLETLQDLFAANASRAEFLEE